MFKTLLIANRGEIACRIATTARRLGIRTIAIYSDADRHAKHVAACDVAVHIGGSAPQHSYLRANEILKAAQHMGAQAIHPGYGFLSENDTFAQAVVDSGLIFIGPPASAIAAMGNKAAAKSLMEHADVPLIPGYHGNNQDPIFLKEQADRIGYPIIIKASSGGGGKGMRIVNDAAFFMDALASCQRESLSSFGDNHVLIERYLQQPRHIEIQIFSDSVGNYVYLFERDCSVQRRHQKVIEEAPAPGMTAQRRKAMGQAAIAAARAVGYIGAGTVEFITEPDGTFYFMEMNTRIQVEHPVTEMITGLDLVEWQLRIAAGQPLPKNQDDLSISGHAFEARIYAENPNSGFLPSVGVLEYLSLPEHAAFHNAPIRIDSGVAQGDAITAYYDPMIAKLIVHGKDRDHARAEMIEALSKTHVVGLHTNIHFLSKLMQDTAFIEADIDTSIIERRQHVLLEKPKPVNTITLALASAALLIRQGMRHSQQHHVLSAANNQTLRDPWDVHDGWRVNNHYQQTFQWIDHDYPIHHVTMTRTNTAWSFQHGQVSHAFSWSCLSDVSAMQAYEISVTLNKQTHTRKVFLKDNTVYLFHEGSTDILSLYDIAHYAQDTSGAQHGGLTAPMPGKIISIAVKAGDTVTAGQALLTLEAMKMEHTISAPYNGLVKDIFYQEGEHVSEGLPLLSIEIE